MTKKKFKWAILLLSGVGLLSFSAYQSSPKKPMNIIFLVGDGMGLSQVSAAYYFGEGEPNFSRFPFVGLSKTSSSKEKITDSAAGATAFATGKKSYNGAVSVDDNKQPLETILERLEKKGYHSALIATSSITHATPASFYAHVDSRNKAYEIARCLVDSEVDFFAGGGLKYFKDSDKNTGLFAKMEQAGFVIDTNTLADAKELDPKKRYGFLLANNGMPKMQEGRGNFLTEAFLAATSYLTAKEKPFFMMVEGSQIDWGGHDNDAKYLIAETLDFDNLLGAALDFAAKDGNTLVVVTADHETGGFTLSAGKSKNENGEEETDYNVISSTFSTGGHSGTMVPVFAFGPGAETFSGVYENTELFYKMLALANKK